MATTTNRGTRLPMVLLAATLACGGTSGGPDPAPDDRGDATPVDVSPADAGDGRDPGPDAARPGDAAADLSADGIDTADAAPDGVPGDRPAGDGAADAPDPGPPDLPGDAAGDAAADVPSPAGCNGHEALCGRRFDEVAYATTHNAMSNEDDGWVAPNQPHSLERQWADGVRAMMLDLWYGDPDVEGMDPSQVYLCHGPCLLGNRPLADALAALRAFLDAHPRDVVTLIFESYVAGADVAAAFEAAGLLPYLHAQARGEPWPTLDEMGASGRRLVVLTDEDGGDPPWHHDVWQHAFETDWDNRVPSDLSCDPNRGNPSNPLFILNHFLTNPFASRDLAAQVNVNPFFLERARRCRDERGRLPNFVTVDFYDVGDLMAVVDDLNGVGPEP